MRAYSICVMHTLTIRNTYATYTMNAIPAFENSCRRFKSQKSEHK